MEALQESTRPRSYILSLDNIYKFWWDVLIIFLAIYNAFALPLQIAFKIVQDVYDESMSLQIFEIFVDFCFAVDIVLMFLQAYMDVVNGETISQPKMIAKNYMKSGFWPDFISTTPIVLKQIVKGNSDLEQIVILFRLLKLMRVRRLSKLISRLRWPKEDKS